MLLSLLTTHREFPQCIFILFTFSNFNDYKGDNHGQQSANIILETNRCLEQVLRDL